MKKIALPSRSIPAQKRTIEWEIENPAHFALNLVNSAKSSDQTLVVIVNDMRKAENLAADCTFFGGDAAIFPDTETLPYDPFSPQIDIISERLSLLFHLKAGKRKIVIITIPTLLERLPPREFFDANVLLFKCGDIIDREQFRLNLEAAGYLAVSNVLSPGEFSARGSLFDLFPMGEKAPLRIDFFDNEIDSIRTFDPESGDTIATFEQLSLLPTRELDMSEKGLKTFAQKYQSTFTDDPAILGKSHIYQETIKGNLPSGIENYMPLFFENSATFFDYLPAATTLILYPHVEQEALRFQELIETRFERYRHDHLKPILPPTRLYLTPKGAESLIANYPQIDLRFTTQFQPSIDLRALKEQAESGKSPLFLCAETSGRRENLLNRLANEEITPVVSPSLKEAFNAPMPLVLLTGALSQGFSNDKPPFRMVTEAEFLGVKPREYRAKGKVADIEAMLTNLDTLEIGDPIIHINHGIGRYAGMDIIDDTELVVIQYRDNAKLYVPVTSLDLLSKYSGSEKSSAPLHKLGSDQWDKARRKAAEKANDTAAELLDIYARREAQSGKGMTPPEEYSAFAESFPYKTTPDQQRAIDAVLADLEIGKMDRIVCGDVGFGKTEVAMRAAFMAAMNGYQVAILAPTTLLAEQHATAFEDRFADWPIKIAALSRFRKSKETREILAALAAGEIDIIIGTHRLLSEDTRFHNLGLVIIDEEHRFGVKQKERLRALRAEVNFMAMTATPIPRTLNMGLTGLKALSIIATPPENRIAVQTFVNEWSDELIVEACMREFKRGGQVYFLHNEVKSIELVAERLNALMPNIAIGMAHGQMHENELEKVMLDFYHHRINILLCTTIIESGIDVPNANTVIINRADHLGLAQLHQIRGRVGRSHHRAFCYLIVPEAAAMTSDAKKRIEAIATTDTLGAGFMLANHDLEIRGAGELLGDQQSGEINAIGFSLYMELLSEAAEMIKRGGKLDVADPFNKGLEITIGAPALIQEDFIFDVAIRLSYYKRIASAKSIDALDQIQIEMIDRFGLLPDATKRLFKLTELKLRAKPLNLKKIEANAQGVRILFGEQPRINTPKLISLIQGQPQFYQLQGQEALRYKLPLESPELRINAISRLIDLLS
ncbi:transcription-repair coupling factor [Ignatzschineria cameli]|uniref:Transcription-repair-coupling factor n=1 Tax=Ignatzschineria cameli TaxID=2182793 RepID=A0ABX5KYD3_9GAMM|nr:transcription-repair coupling factor [Ignatzschineria cameli]PWD85406.1 transcription-repair coupling factor [Ignatzschineria cameli]PWD88879.1 transcription-repair coupling factor [Ignatzschineria cameli]PWD90269.1 transcription-repair coupling factor [Ignatzschineria cameli]PWD90696.1 transcription-repair coupling factor [Ignatzschineria cameli]